MKATAWPSTRRASVAAAVVILAALLPTNALGAQPRELSSALVITKSSNRNEVNYAVQVDDVCAPSGTSPVHPYWRMLERGASAVEPLSGAEQRALGVERQDVSGHLVHMTLRGMPNRPITIETERAADGQCSSFARMTIAAVPARLARVFVKQELFGIAYVLLSGWAEDGSVVQERVVP